MMQRPLVAALQTTLSPLSPTQVWIGYSGGLDSQALLYATATWAKTQATAPALYALHVHHGLHPQADQWAEFCAHHCAQLGIPLRVERVKLECRPGSSVEAAARTARYAAFSQVLAPGQTLLTAHHQDDQAET